MATQVLTGSWSHLVLVLGPRPPMGARCKAGLESSHPETPAPGQGMGAKAPSFLCLPPPAVKFLHRKIAIYTVVRKSPFIVLPPQYSCVLSGCGVFVDPGKPLA